MLLIYIGCLTKFTYSLSDFGIVFSEFFSNQKRSYENCKEIEFAGIFSVVFDRL
jgi:hypothetical protein